MMSTNSFILNTGKDIPRVGLGCWMGHVGDSQDVGEMVRTALRVGYRHLDTASNYGNERSVGLALKESGIPRREVFITTKLAGEDHGRVAQALQTSLANLQTDYVDLFLVHWPQAFTETGKTLQPEESPTISETWKQMEEVFRAGNIILILRRCTHSYSLGKARAIGVSNFSVKTLTTLLEHAHVVPAVNQVEMHPCLPQPPLLAFCRDRGILITAYSPIGKNKFSTDPLVVKIAAAHAAKETQILLSWGVQRGTCVIPKTTKEERLRDNLVLVELSSEEMTALDNLHLSPGMHRSVCGFHSTDLGGSCFGWIYAQLGWDLALGGVASDSA
ncbi:Aado keto reductase [Favolaschia claudopus]|uniref:Aado keto reductase n=1 Tax=Favolaschia claudopus TaxID=2862362 RepID=A0AAW0BPY3_9AGAR